MTELTCQANNYESQTANVNGVRIHYLRAGTGKTPLLSSTIDDSGTTKAADQQIDKICLGDEQNLPAAPFCGRVGLACI